ncbi:MAG: anthranilate phosphoribosyltransferase [Bacillota bacterium]
MIKEALSKVTGGEDLSLPEAKEVMQEIMTGQVTPAQMGGYLVALRMKGETIQEIAGSALAMREQASLIRPSSDVLLDTCGTGGDGAGSFNISTTVAIIAAAAGIRVAKHGNRAVSSNAGSADVLEALGIKVDLAPQKVQDCIDSVGIGFMFAPVFHQAMKHAAGPRRELGMRTIFNLLGPLTNPAQVNRQVLGVFAPHLTEVFALVLAEIGCEKAFVLHGHGGMDELSLSGPNKVTKMSQGRPETFLLSAEDLRLRKAGNDALKGGTARENAEIILRVLGGEESFYRDAVLLNAAPCFVLADFTDNLQEGVRMSAEVIGSGAAMKKLEEWKEFTQKVA